MPVADLLYDVVVQFMCLSTQRCVLHSHTRITHRLNEPVTAFCPLPPFIPLLMKPPALVSHVPENNIQFTEISLLHRRFHQSGLIAEIDASCPRLPSKRIHPPARSHFSVKQQLIPNKCIQQQLVILWSVAMR